MDADEQPISQVGESLASLDHSTGEICIYQRCNGLTFDHALRTLGLACPAFTGWQVSSLYLSLLRSAEHDETMSRLCAGMSKEEEYATLAGRPLTLPQLVTIVFHAVGLSFQSLYRALPCSTDLHRTAVASTSARRTRSLRHP